MVKFSLVCSLKRSQTGLALAKDVWGGIGLTALASSTWPAQPDFSDAVSCSTRPRSLNVVSSRYACGRVVEVELLTVLADHSSAGRGGSSAGRRRGRPTVPEGLPCVPRRT